MTGRRSCEHKDVRYVPDEQGAIACFVCGRLFGYLDDNGIFRAYNPSHLKEIA